MINRSSIPDGIFNRPEIIVQNYDFSRFFRGLRTASHSEAHIGPLQRRGIVDAVSRHAHDQIHLLTQPHHPRFIRRQSSRDHPDFAHDSFYRIVAHLIELRRSQRQIPAGRKQPRVFSDGHRSLQTVPGNHHHLDSRILNLSDCGLRFRPHIIPNCRQTDENHILIYLILSHLLPGISECQHTHGPSGRFVNLLVQSAVIQPHFISVSVKSTAGRLQQFFRRAFIKSHPQRIDLRLTEFVGGIETLRDADPIKTVILQHTRGILSNEPQQRLICGVSAHHPVALRKHRRRISADSYIEERFDLTVSPQILRKNRLPLSGKKFHHFQFAFCNRTRLIAE